MSKQHKVTTSAEDASQQEDFPGYPPYPPEDDIVRHDKRVEGNLGADGFESADQVKSAAPVAPPQQAPDESSAGDNDEFDVTDEDLEALGPVDLSLDMGEDEQLKQRTHPVDFAGESLDVPGAEEDDKSE